MTHLYLIRGLPGSGKSTIAKKLVEHNPTIVHLEADMYFIQEDGSYVWNVLNIGSAHQWCQSKTDENLFHGKSVVVSNTFTTKNELKPYFVIAKKYDIVPTVVLCMNQFGSIHNVPLDTLLKMKARFEYDISSFFE
jgi:predicted kinase